MKARFCDFAVILSAVKNLGLFFLKKFPSLSLFSLDTELQKVVKCYLALDGAKASCYATLPRVAIEKDSSFILGLWRMELRVLSLL